MATSRTLRRGLPRVPGGDPWPPAADAPLAEDDVSSPAPAAAALNDQAAGSAAPAPPLADRPSTGSGPAEGETARAEPVATADASVAIRRGLPRTPGGEPWPPAGAAVTAQVADASSPAPALDDQSDQSEDPAAAPAPLVVERAEGETKRAASDTPIRRGLPRVPGGEAWPPAGFAPAAETIETIRAVDAEPVAETLAEPVAETLAEPVAEPAPAAPVPVAAQSAQASPVPDATATDVPLPFTRTVFATASSDRWNADRVATQGKAPIAPPEPPRYGPFTRLQWAGAVIVAGAGLLIAAGMAVLFVRWFLSLEFMQDFLAAYPGEYDLPSSAPVGFPAWLGWQHFFNIFLIVLIIRSGITIRTEKRPTAFWAPRRDPKGKVSLTIWFHQSLDILWLVNGVVFVVLLFVTAQWMRVIPTSWEVFPNALSAALQYVSLDWPTENGWVNYNSLQQLAYFATIFLAAPLAAITGARMSGLWPKNAKGLNKAYPIEWARAVHFPVMIYFVLFIIAHVTLVFATGALRNLNHMFAVQGSPDPNAYADNWAGFWIFVAAMVVVAAGWVAARPLVLAPIARLFGTVSSR
ncbi:MAG TPA: cytochrome b/b6 domain-containing protein [Microbacterium sp.]|nr:cytochrome b/b6 domain-containing protein [Microbacterium sp.]